ncbi:chorion peroxidase-like [Littorina saxatilis]|uniref:Peroxidase n=1 Tax=Littorina saxatilis TaxID=31220 RepID=A0AAN9GBZ1_9CAEN
MKYTLITAAVFLWISICLKSIACSEVPDNSPPTRTGGAPELADAGSTGSIYVHPEPIVQNFNTECHEPTKYRSADGTCNSIFNLGSANTPLRRMLPPQYDDAIGAPRRRAKDGSELPSATAVSKFCHDDRNAHGNRTLMFMQFGQIIDHDLILSPIPVSEQGGPHCCKNGKVANSSAAFDCLPIKMKDKRFHGECMEFSRSIPASSHAHGYRKVPREQLNIVTSFFDGSTVYGSSEEQLELLRDSKSRALMKVGENGLLPRSEHGECHHRPEDYCFLAGDPRVNEQPGLVAMHTLWVLLHNRIAEKLQHVRPKDDPEHIFHLSRKILVGIMQNIFYSEWLPLVLSKDVRGAYGLWTGFRVAYSTSVDPSIINAFSAAAFRFGHTLIPREYNVSGVIFPLRKLFFRPDLVFDNFHGMLKALVDPTNEDMQAQQIDQHLVVEVTGHLFEPADQEPDAPSRGLDLVALNIQRGRDHGLPPYNEFRKICGLPAIESFDEFGPIGASLSSVYNSVDDIDLFTGGLLESSDTPGKLGPTFSCIIATQLRALKFGDRFYFETTRSPEGFNDEQLKSIRRVTLSKVLCFFPGDYEFKDKKGDVIRHIQRDAFIVPSDTNTIRPCNRLRRKFLNFALWEQH